MKNYNIDGQLGNNLRASDLKKTKLQDLSPGAFFGEEDRDDPYEGLGKSKTCTQENGMRKGVGGGNILRDRTADKYIGPVDKYGNPI